MKTISRVLLSGLLAALVASLVACSGGGGGGDAVDPPVTPPVTPVTPAAPQIVTQPLAVTLEEGLSTTLAVVASGDGLSYQWLRNGAPISGAQAASYALGPVTLADNGALFSVRVSNAGGEVTSAQAVLTVTARPVVPQPPVIALQPAAQSVTVGQRASFSVAASSTSAISYQWLRNGTAITDAQSAVYTTPATVLADDGAVFSVRVTSNGLTVTSAGAVLRVSAPPVDTRTWAVESAGLTVSGSVSYFDRTVNHSTSALVALRTDAPATATQTLAAGGAISNALASFFEASAENQTFRNVRQRYSVVFRGGKLWRIDHRPADPASALQQISTLSSNQVCSGNNYPTGNDRGNALQSWLFLRAPGADGLCETSDDTALAVRLDMAASAEPVAVPRPLVAITNASSNLTGVFVRQGTQVLRLDAQLANAETVFTTSDEPVSLGIDFLSSNPTWLLREGMEIVGRPLANPASRTVLTTLVSGEYLPGQSFAGNADRSMVYFAIATAASGRIIGVSKQLASTALGTVPYTPNLIDETPTALILGLSNGRVVSLPKTGGTPTTVYTVTGGDQLRSLATGAENVYIQVQEGISGRLHVRIANSDGSNVASLVNTRLFAGLFPSPYPLGASRQALVLASDDGGTSTTLRAITAATRAELFSYGTIPAPANTVRGMATQPYLWGDAGVLGARSANDQPTFLYFIRTDAANSLVAIPAAAD